MAEDKNKSLSDLLDGIDRAGDGQRVSFRDMLEEVGDNAITPFILMIAVLMVSPLSGIPGTPTISALIIVTIAVQGLSGRKRLWLPDFLMRRRIKARYLHRAVEWLRRPCAFLDHHSQKRLTFLTKGPARWITMGVVALIPLSWPALEILPMVTSVGAATIALLVFGLFTRDGVWVLWGYSVIGLAGLAAVSII